MNEAKKRIFWKSEHWQAVAKRSYIIRKDPLFKGSDVEAVRIAQREVLPAELHRNLISMAEVARIPGMWDELRAQGYAQDQSIINPVIPAEQRPAILSVSDIPTGDLMAELMKRIADVMNPDYIRAIAREEANAVIERRIPGLLPPDPGPVAEEKIEEPEQRKYRVCVIGLMGSQQETLKRNYGRLIDFHFLSGSEGANRIKATVERMEFTVRSKWCKGTLGSTSGWPNFTSAGDGGLDTIMRLINNRFKLN
jgi:hypothetical protein